MPPHFFHLTRCFLVETDLGLPGLRARATAKSPRFQARSDRFVSMLTIWRSEHRLRWGVDGSEVAERCVDDLGTWPAFGSRRILEK